ncbi:MAG: dihydroorotate dehydrogenase (quinone), partial [Deltaproteobacteria bacterium]|nr:dihydroorotate dehydrogenase (quinone) [Deltaproteobacteria bacterium]
MLDVVYPLIRPLLFSLDAEQAHATTLRALAAAPRLAGRVAALTMGPPPSELARDAFGVRLAGPVGLAAGLDKDAIALPFWPSLGFGFVEVGTVTAHPQPGNPRPRLFRLPRDRALINRMGFNNHGSAALASLLRSLRARDRWPEVPVGVNVGKSKVTPLAEAHSDYATSVRRLQGLADYFAVNVSSPNTPGLREL